MSDEFPASEPKTRPDSPRSIRAAAEEPLVVTGPGGWGAKIPTVLLVTILTAVLGGGAGVTSRIEERLDRIEAKIERRDERAARRELELERRLAALEGARGRPGN